MRSPLTHTQQARCNGTVAQNEYPPTPGFPSASASGLSLYVYWNGTDQGQGGANIYERVQSTLSGGVMAWWTNVVTSLAGEACLASRTACPLTVQSSWGGGSWGGGPTWPRRWQVRCPELRTLSRLPERSDEQLAILCRATQTAGARLPVR